MQCDNLLIIVLQLEHTQVGLWHAGCAKVDLVDPEPARAAAQLKDHLKAAKGGQVEPLRGTGAQLNLHQLPLVVQRDMIAQGHMGAYRAVSQIKIDGDRLGRALDPQREQLAGRITAKRKRAQGAVPDRIAVTVDCVVELLGCPLRMIGITCHRCRN